MSGFEGSALEADIERVLLSEAEIAARIDELAANLRQDLAAAGAGDDGIVLMPVMTGSMLFVADLVRRLPQKLRLELALVSSYPGKAMESRGAKLSMPLPTELAGRHVVIVDDILDSGGTIRFLRSELAKQSPASLRSVVLLRKPRPDAIDVACEHVGFEIPDEFVVGYGLDFDGLYRNLPYIGTLRPDARR
ncbi:MAG: phosphoribosyltransferase [Phycisphaerales bacterium]|jgi:hypoxanthine phosphoribosyltransferase